MSISAVIQSYQETCAGDKLRFAACLANCQRELLAVEKPEVINMDNQDLTLKITKRLSNYLYEIFPDMFTCLLPERIDDIAGYYTNMDTWRELNQLGIQFSGADGIQQTLYQSILMPKIYELIRDCTPRQFQFKIGTFTKVGEMLIQIIYADNSLWFQPREDCSICLEEVIIPEILPCGHLFHLDCIFNWKMANHNTCPMCRSPLPTENSIRWWLRSHERDNV